MVGNRVSKLTRSKQFAQALMLEQIEFIRTQLLQAKNNTYIENIVHQIFINADKIQLQQAIHLDQLNGVVQKYAFELNLGPDILEFIGVIAQKIHLFASSSPTTYNELLSDDSFEIWMYKILELDQVREYINDNLQNNPHAQHISLQLANQILENHTPWLNQLRKYKTQDQRITSRIVNFIQDQQQHIELKLEQQLSQALLKQLSNIIMLPNDELAEIVLEIWSDIKTRTMQDTFSNIQAIDVEDFFILVYETWKSVRKTEYLQAVVLQVVAGFYEYFSEYNLQELLNAVGLTEQDLHQEAYRFAPYCFKALDDAGILVELIKAFIAPFYEAERTSTLIQNLLNQNPEH